MVFKEITTETEIPVGSDMVVVELEDVLNGSFDSASILYGFSAKWAGMGYVNPVYGFIDIGGGESFSLPDADWMTIKKLPESA